MFQLPQYTHLVTANSSTNLQVRPILVLPGVVVYAVGMELDTNAGFGGNGSYWQGKPVINVKSLEATDHKTLFLIDTSIEINDT